MNNLLKFLGIIFVFSIILLLPFSEAKSDNTTSGHDQSTTFTQSKEGLTVYIFDDRWCPVCQDAKSYINSVIDDYPDFDLEIYSITDTDRIREVADEADVEEYRIMAPMIFVGDQLLQFNNFGERQEEMILSVFEGGSADLSGGYIFPIPFTEREIEVKEWSLPVVTFVLGSLDGFNVCSLGALILILSLVMVLQSRKLIFFYGGLFILTSVIIYGIMVFVWGQLFEVLLGHLAIFRYMVGIAAGAGAVYFFKEFWRFYRFGPTCQSSDSNMARNATQKILKVFKDPSSQPLALAGAVVTFAAVITIVELPCSIGVPVAFTAIVIERGVSIVAYTGYILFYLFFYMLIEIIVFTGAVMTKKLWFANSKMVTWITLAGALVLTYLSLYYLIGW